MPKLSSFPFLRLPLLVQLLILQHFRLDQLVNFSFLSTKTKNIVKNLKRQIEEFTWLLQYGKRSTIKCYSQNQFVDFSVASGELEEPWKFQLGSHIIHHKPPQIDSEFVHSYHEFGTTNSTEDEVLAAIEDLSRHLLELFNCDHFELMCFGKRDIKNMFIWEHTKQIEKVKMDFQDVDVEEITFLMNDVNIKSLETEFCCYRERELYSGPVALSHLDTTPLKWMTFDSFRNMECEEVRIEQDSLAFKNLRKCLKDWKTGAGWKNMKYFRMRRSTDESVYDRELKQILGNLETFSWNRSGLPKRWKEDGQFSVDIENGRGIRRNDGRLATVFHEGQYFYHQFYFVVWEEGLECEEESAEWEFQYSSDEDSDSLEEMRENSESSKEESREDQEIAEESVQD